MAHPQSSTGLYVSSGKSKISLKLLDNVADRCYNGKRHPTPHLPEGMHIMAATKTRTRKAAAKKAAPKAKAPAAPKAKAAAKPKSRKGRTSPALKNRHRWTEDELASLAAQVNAAGYGQKQPIYEAVAKQIGNGITWQSVRAQFYAYEAQGKGATSGLSAAPELPADPIA